MAGGTDNRLKRKSLPARLRPPPGGPLSTPERTPQRGLTLHATRSVDPEQLSDDAASTLHGRTQPFYGGHEFGLAHACGRLFHGLRRASDRPGTNAAGRSRQNVGRCGYRWRATRPHSPDQHRGLTVEQLEHFAFQAAVATRHPGQVHKINGTLVPAGQRICVRL